MSHYDEFRGMFGNASPKEKLAVLRSESRRLLSSARGCSQIMHKIVEERKPSELPDDFGTWCEKVAESVEELQDLIDALTDWKHRSILQQERAERDKEFGEMLWESSQKGLSELEDYTSLRDALEKTANRLNLSLLMANIKIDDSFWHPGSGVTFLGANRQARIGTQRGDHTYLGYAITLKWLVDKRNLEWHENKSIAPTLEEVIMVLHLWLVKEQDLQIIWQKHSWMSSDTIQHNE